MTLVLSDIHIRNASDPILSRTQALVDAAKNVETGVNCILIVLCGDTTWSGTDQEYLLAIDFVSDLKSKLLSEFPGCPFFVIAVPGNHDCDFSLAGQAREAIAEVISSSPEKLLDRSFANICLEPLATFFDFSDTLECPHEVIFQQVDKRLYREYRVSGDAGSITFYCCNTAALSRIHEQQGSLVFPKAIIKHRGPQSDICIGIFHHPYNWLKADNAKVVFGEMANIADYIITGHEHAFALKTQAQAGSFNVLLEAGVLQDPGDSSTSDFAILILDAKEKKQRLIKYSWSETKYVPSNSEPDQFNLWENLYQNPKRMKEAFLIQDDFVEFLEDFEVNISHRSKDHLKLSDLYVYPDLKRIFLNSQSGLVTKGDFVPALIQKSPCLFIVGDDFSGKTALSKRIFQDLRNQGDIPVYINVGKSDLNEKHLNTQIEKAFLSQYKNSSIDNYRQLDRTKRVIIIDNYHRIGLSVAHKTDLLRALRKHSFRLIIFAHELELTFADVSEAYDNASTDLPFLFFAILPFNLLRRNRIVERWLMLDEEADVNTEKFVHNLETINKTLDSLVGHNFIPSYPSYIIAILQATEAGTEIDVNASTHGYLYELFIKTAIAKKTTAVGNNVISSYLAHLAFWMYSKNRRDISRSELRQFHQSLQEEVEVLPAMELLLSELDEMQLLQVKGETIRFRHKYIYYYFIAVTLRDGISTSKTREEIGKISSKLYKEDEANILLFLSHLCKDVYIVDTLISVANKQCSTSQEATLDTDVSFLNQLNSEVNQLRIAEIGHRESREIQLQTREAAIEQETSMGGHLAKDDTDESSFLCQINIAVKSIQILGQFLKNFPADLDKQKKDEIILASCSVGRRVLGCFLNLVTQVREGMIREMLAVITKNNPEIRNEKMEEKVVAMLVALCEMASSGVILRLSQSLGSATLMPIYERVFRNAKEPVLSLVYTSLQLSHQEHFPEIIVREEAAAVKNNPFAFRILRSLVLRRVQQYPTDFKTKQTLSSQFHFELESVKKTRSELLIEEERS